MSEKKRGFWQQGGLLPISQSRSRYSTLYRDTAGAPSHDTVERVLAGARSRATIRPAMRTIQRCDMAGLRAAARARMAWPGVSLDTKIILWLGATVCVAIWRSRAAIQRCDTVGRASDMASNARCVGLGVTIQFCIARGGGDTAGGDLRHDTQAPRYDAQEP